MATEDEDQVTQDEKGAFTWKKGKWAPLWALFMVPFLLVALPLYRWVRTEVSWAAAWITVAVFEMLLMPVEWYSLGRGHWVYNEARILGPKIFGIPIEEPLLYYLFSPLIIICIYHAFLKWGERK